MDVNNTQPNQATQPPPPPPHDVNASVSAPTETHPPKPKRHIPWPKILVFGIVALITIAAIGLIAYLFMENQNESQMVNDNSSIVNENPTPTPDPTADWNIYENEEFGFSFKYPSEFKIEDSIPQSFTPEPSINRFVKLTDESGRSLIYMPNVDGFGPIFAHKGFELSYSMNKGFTVDNEEIFEVGEYHDKDKIQIISYPEVTTDKKYYSYLSYTYDKNDIDAESIYKQILSTFKFTEENNSISNAPTPTDAFSNWETYNDANYPFNIKYPDSWELRTTYGKSVNNLNNDRIAGIDITSARTYGSTVIINIIDPEENSFNDWVKKYSGFGASAPQKPNYTYNGIAAYKYEGEGSGGRKNTIIIYPYKDKLIYLEWHNFDYDQEITDKIMSTLELN